MSEPIDPALPEVDDKDWTWAITQPCADCGYDPTGLGRDRIAATLLSAADRWVAVLGRAQVGRRPEPRVWSPLEYACHVRDVLALFAERAWLIRREDDPVFANWDQDATALEQRYWEADPAVVADQLRAAGTVAAEAFSGVADPEWARPGRRSNGSVFTLQTLGVYFVHDVVHHLWDVQG